MAERPRDALDSIEKLAIDERPLHTPKVTTETAMVLFSCLSMLILILLLVHF